MKSAWRIVKRAQVVRAFDGEGARIHGGRWNSPGTPVVYLATSRALALLEILVHLADADHLAQGWVLVEVEYEARDRRDLPRSKVPGGFAANRASPTTRAIGDAWVEQRESLLLGVPSAVVPAEQNLLLNPAHPRMRRLRIHATEPLRIDPRLFRKG